MTAYKSIEVEIKTKPLRKQEMKMQAMKDRMDESLGMRRGKESSKKQTLKDRRDESMGMKKKAKKMKKKGC